MQERKRCIVCGYEFFPKLSKSVVCSGKCWAIQDYAKNKDRYKRRSIENYRDNLERCRKQRKRYYWSDPERFRERTKRWARQNVRYKRTRDLAYKDKIRHGGMRQRLIAQFGYVCSSCGKEKSSRGIVVHHITFDPTKHDQQELLCRSCHALVHL